MKNHASHPAFRLSTHQDKNNVITGLLLQGPHSVDLHQSKMPTRRAKLAHAAILQYDVYGMIQQNYTGSLLAFSYVLSVFLLQTKLIENTAVQRVGKLLQKG